MIELTEKQVAARTYYAANAEKIKAAKRATYKANRQYAPKKSQENSWAGYKNKKEKAVVVAPTNDGMAKVRQQPAMSRIEDILNERKAEKGMLA
tara:strand:+ start:78574 stop:78855 length:282 start_codon:yes stop_codon:yes gene_type:complete